MLLLLDCLITFIFICVLPVKRQDPHWANYATCQEQRAGGLSLLPAAQSGYTTQNREAHGNNAVALVSRANSSHSMRTPHHLHSAWGTGANKSLTGFGRGTMCGPGDVYRIHWGSEIAHWKNLSVGHQACFHWAGSHSVRLAAPGKLRAALNVKGCLCALVAPTAGPGKCSEQGKKGPSALPATCPGGAG